MAAVKYDPAFPWAICKDGVGRTCSCIPYCGYPLPILKSMASAGYYLYYQGKKAKLSGLTEAIVDKERRKV